MCKVNLNVSTQPCAHRWYQLIEPCSPSLDLSSCNARVKLQGWEQRTTSCPFCIASPTMTSLDSNQLLSSPDTCPSPEYTPGTHRLLTPQGTSPSISPCLSRKGSIDAGTPVFPSLCSPSISAALSKGSIDGVYCSHASNPSTRASSRRNSVYTISSTPTAMEPSGRDRELNRRLARYISSAVAGSEPISVPMSARAT